MLSAAMHAIFRSPGSGAIPIYCIDAASYGVERDGLDAAAWRFARAAGFEAKPGRMLLLPGKTDSGEIGGVLFGTDPADPFAPGRLPGALPPGTYRLVDAPDPRLAALSFALGSYQFARYRKADERKVTLELPANIDAADATGIIEAVSLARDLINTPTNDMGPAELEAAARALATRHGASVRSIVGDDLVHRELPADPRGRARRGRCRRG